MFLFAVIALVALLILAPRFTGFPSQSLAEYKGKGPQFDPRTHLSGPILCEGVIYGPFGRVSSRFVADMEGKWDGTRGTLTERFRYDSGATQDRAWRLSLSNDGSIRAEADDLVGAGSGRTEGPACEMRYRIRLPAEAGGHVLDVVDWMYLMPNGTIMNRSQFRKFGIKVAELIATMRPMPAAA
ncbi:DUF3833 family protein [bacterium]|nr:DUF3833 family protein [bacterium]